MILIATVDGAIGNGSNPGPTMLDKTVSPADLHAAMGVVRDVCDQWHDPPGWRAALLRGCCRLLDGHSAAITGQTLSADGRFGQPLPLATFGLPEPVRRATYERVIEQTRGGRVDDVSAIVPGYRVMFDRFRSQGWATVARADIVADAEHAASAFQREFRAAAGCDDYVASVRSVDQPSRIEVLMVDRRLGAPRFGPREVQLLKLVHDCVAPLVGVRLATEAFLSVDGLSRRLRETLDLLLAGRSEREVAADLGLGITTVHDYVGRLYAHFAVSGRAELMAYFVQRVPKLRPPPPPRPASTRS